MWAFFGYQETAMKLTDRYTIQPNGCWIWKGTPNCNGYGRISIGSRGSAVRWLAHRWVYTMLIGPIPDDMTLDHVKARGCTSRMCVNPAHLEPVTRGENVLRGEHPNVVAHRSGRCTKGHPVVAGQSGRRRDGRLVCLVCWPSYALVA